MHLTTITFTIFVVNNNYGRENWLGILNYLLIKLQLNWLIFAISVYTKIYLFQYKNQYY